MRHILIVMLLASVALAGCSGEPPSVEEDPTFEEFDDTVSTGKGLIRGVVVDPTVTPIVEATVNVQGSELSTVTNENGAFQFKDLEPGVYFLEISKLGYEPIQSSAEVQADVASPAIVRIQLEPRPEDLPTAFTITYDAFISCGFKTATFVWGAGSCDPTGALGMAARDDSAPVFEAGRPDAPSHYQSEVLWSANQPLSSGLVTIQCNRDNSGCGSGVGSDRLCNIRGPSPLICRINNDVASEDVPGGGNNFTTIRDGAGWSPTYTIGLYSNCAVQCDPVFGSMGVGVAIDQKVSFYVTLFYNHIPEEDWTFTTDGDYFV